MSSTRDFIASTVADSMLPYIRRPVEDIIYETLDTRQVPNRTDFRELRDLVNSLRGQLSGATGGVRKLAEQLDELSERLDDGPDGTDTSAVDQVRDDVAALAGQLERASKVAVQLARAKNNEWLPAGTSEAYLSSKTAIYKEKGILTGSTLKGEIDPDIAKRIRPALDTLGDVVELLSCEAGTGFRFKYHGLIKNKRGMAAWTGTLIRDCDVDCTGVVFETGHRKRDPAYDGGSHWYGPY